MDPWLSLWRCRRSSRAERAAEFIEECRRSGIIDDSRFGHVRAAVAFLGPPVVPPDPARVDDMVVLAARRTEDRAEAATNVAIALGVGWSREVDLADRDPWLGVWDDALFGLADEFARSIQFSASMLTRLVPTVRLDRSEHRSLSELFAMEFVFGCRCGRHRRSCTHRNGHGCCIDRHSIATWDPSVAHLSAYVDQAVRGLADSSIRGAAFADGMFYAELHRTGRIRRAFVEAYECPTCGRREDEMTCSSPGCDGRASDRPWKRVALANRLVAPVESGGNHAAETREVCGNELCENLFPVRGDHRCPRCGWQPVERLPRSRQVWVRVGPPLRLVPR